MTRLLAILFMLTISVGVYAQDVHLESCRQLPIVKVTVSKQQFQFLLDTGAAATLLNLKSFSSADATEVTMESWTGSASAAGRQVVLHDLAIGDQALENLKLLAIDLTPLERSCQRRVDGVLGADLIEKFGLTIDLKNHVATLHGNAKTTESKFDQLDQHVTACEQAFNRSDDKAFEECLDPEIVFLTSK